MEKANKIKLGAFVLVSILLLGGSFIVTGALRIFTPKVKAVTILNTSVEGLAVGSQVKYLGLSIGRITRIAMREDDSYIAVYFDLSPSAIDQIGKNRKLGSANDLAGILKKHNPGCFINASGIMGGTFLELTLGGQQPPALPHVGNLPPGVLYIHSRPSHIGSAIQNVSRVLEELGRVNFVLLADKLDQVLDSVNDVFSRGDLLSMLKHLNTISRDLEASAGNLRQIISDENIRKFNKSLANLERASVGLTEVVSPENARELMSNINITLNALRKFIKDAESVGGSVDRNFTELRVTLDDSLVRLDNSSRRLNTFLSTVEDNPNQFVRGKQPPDKLQKEEFAQ